MRRDRSLFIRADDWRRVDISHRRMRDIADRRLKPDTYPFGSVRPAHAEALDRKYAYQRRGLKRERQVAKRAAGALRSQAGILSFPVFSQGLDLRKSGLDFL